MMKMKELNEKMILESERKRKENKKNDTHPKTKHDLQLDTR